MSLAAAGLLVAAGAGAAESLGDAVKESKLLIDWRVRYEGVEQTGFDEKADPLTTRVRAGFQTGQWGKTSLLGEIVAVESVSGEYNSTINGETDYPVVPDPEDILTVNRFAFTNNSLDNVALTFGRQRIIYDDSRFVGNVGWRQFEQTFDGLRAAIGGSGPLKADLAYITQVNRIFGPDSPAGKLDGDIVLANVSRPFEAGTLTGFVYSLDIDEATALSTNTIGVRFTGSRPLGDITGIYTASLAQQTDYGDNAADMSEMYLKLEGGLTFGKLTVALGLEELGSDGVNRVQMPLATLHAFQGWADKFLATPQDGMEDSYARIAWQSGAAGPFTGFSVAALYHQFDADVGSAHYGDEFDFQLTARTESLVFTLKYAAYEADELYTDTDKIWVSMDYSF